MVGGKKTLVPPSEINNDKEGSSSFLGKSFQNRRKGLMKKAYEFSTLCDTDACIICYGPDGSLGTWPENNEQVEAAIQRLEKKRYLDFSDLDPDPSSSSGDRNENKKKKKHRSDLDLDPSWVVDVDANKGLDFDYSIWDNRLEKLPLDSLRNLKYELDSEKLIECKKRGTDEQLVHQDLSNLNGTNNPGNDGDQVLPWGSLANLEMIFDDQFPLSPLEFREAGLSDFDEDYDGLDEQDIASILNDIEPARMCTFESIISQAPSYQLENGFLNNTLY